MQGSHSRHTKPENNLSGTPEHVSFISLQAERSSGNGQMVAPPGDSQNGEGKCQVLNKLAAGRDCLLEWSALEEEQS